jgi:DNA invertase Pin-like site-specific DNA recombinase
MYGGNLQKWSQKHRWSVLLYSKGERTAREGKRSVMTSRRNRPSSLAASPQPGWAVYLRTSSDENQKPELSRARPRFLIDTNVLQRSDLPLVDEYVDVLTGKTPRREGYQRLLRDARSGRFSHVIVERADRFGRNDTEALRAIDELHEFGVAVRFANSPDLMDPDDRVLVALSFTLARRESALLSIRVRDGLQAKRQSGGYVSLAPDGYRNVEGRTELSQKHDLGRFNHWIEVDRERTPIWREA